MDKRRLITLENKLRAKIQEAVEDGWVIRPGSAGLYWSFGRPIEANGNGHCILGSVCLGTMAPKTHAEVHYQKQAAKALKISVKDATLLEAGFEGCGFRGPESKYDSVGFASTVVGQLGARLRDECAALFTADVLAMVRG